MQKVVVTVMIFFLMVLKLEKGGSGDVNESGGTYIYMAFAENPFVTSTGIPCTAR